jgi:hypothetical protein
MVGTVPAAGHRPQVPRDAILGGVELCEVLLEPELRDGGELSVGLGGSARLEVRVRPCRANHRLRSVPMWKKRVCVTVMTTERDVSFF